ncbi:type IV conjugative transfer system protein TraE [Pseudoduganella violacea]|uniref:Conjugal transfer pilus assembly protein TraE n=1 Tax=Pseudoduganella violacea TaxID=1715466 RepID=A0A7W5BFU8_9BURK|nr:type IV conjugative transfer system protein TraE [Pseudoduganella violacea]MBB3122178.1 conjugal transfer pilus assembly protein TraE [Pseudoduganella violacea]
MDHLRYQDDLKGLKDRIRGQRLAIGALTACLSVALLTVYQTLGTQRIVVTPPTVDKPFWVSGARVSNAYLEQMGGYVAWLILDVTPASVQWKKEALLSFVEPDEAGALKIRQEVEAERLKKLNASTYFLLQQLEPDEEKQTVLLSGRLRTYVNGQETSVTPKRYLAQFSYRGGRSHLKAFKEVDRDQQNIAATDGARQR